MVWLVAEAAALKMPLNYHEVVLCSLTPLHGVFLHDEGRTNGNPLDFANTTLGRRFWNSSRSVLLGVFLFSSRETLPQSVDPCIVLLVQGAKGSGGFMGEGKVVSLKIHQHRRTLWVCVLALTNINASLIIYVNIAFALGF